MAEGLNHCIAYGPLGHVVRLDVIVTPSLFIHTEGTTITSDHNPPAQCTELAEKLARGRRRKREGVR